MRIKNRNPWFLISLLLIGMIFGGIIGDMFKDKINILNYNKSVGFQPFTIDFMMIKLTLGLVFNLNLGSILGIIVTVLVFNRL